MFGRWVVRLPKPMVVSLARGLLHCHQCTDGRLGACRRLDFWPNPGKRVSAFPMADRKFLALDEDTAPRSDRSGMKGPRGSVPGAIW